MNIYVGNLPLELTDDELRNEFVAFGQVKSINLMNDKNIGSGQPWGYGFVEMALKSEGSAALNALKGKTIKGRVLQVIEARNFSGNKDNTSSDTRRGKHFNRMSRRNKFNHLP